MTASVELLKIARIHLPVTFGVAASSSSLSAVKPFVGKLQQMIVNGHEVLEVVRTGTTFAAGDGDALGGRSRNNGAGAASGGGRPGAGGNDVSATLVGGQVDSSTGSIRSGTAITFRSTDAYTIVQMRIHLKFSIYFKVSST
jgi:hypothetical protein